MTWPVTILLGIAVLVGVTMILDTNDRRTARKACEARGLIAAEVMRDYCINPRTGRASRIP